jgi:hypothetical protein
MNDALLLAFFLFSTIYILEDPKVCIGSIIQINLSKCKQKERITRNKIRRRDIENYETMFGYKSRCIQEISLNSRDLDK